MITLITSQSVAFNRWPVGRLAVHIEWLWFQSDYMQLKNIIKYIDILNKLVYTNRIRSENIYHLNESG